jgi:hypothetical protein
MSRGAQVSGLARALRWPIARMAFGEAAEDRAIRILEDRHIRFLWLARLVRALGRRPRIDRSSQDPSQPARHLNLSAPRLQFLRHLRPPFDCGEPTPDPRREQRLAGGGSRRPLRGAVLALVFAVAGCGDPYASEPREPSSRASATNTAGPAGTSPQPVPGDAGPPAAPQAPSLVRVEARATRSPRSLARAYAQLGINWDWRTLTAQLHRAQPLAAEPLLDELTQTAEEARTDESLKRDHSGARGRVLTVAVTGGGSTRDVLVVTREQQVLNGHATLEGPRTHVYTGKAQRTGAGWRMVDWHLEP